VAGASASLIGRRGQRLAPAVDLAEYADIAEVRQAIEDRVVAHARQALDDPDLLVDVELRPGRTRSAGHGVR
jgi:DNA-binding GntR family transcriptional regulator